MDKKIGEIMTRDVQVIRPDSTLQEAAQRMDDINIGCLPVCDGERLVGLITDRDIIIRAISAGKDPKTSVVRDSMTAPVNYCFEEQPISEIANMMERMQIRRLPVVNRDKRLVGIVSLGDLAVRSEDRELVSEVTAEVSKPLPSAA